MKTIIKICFTTLLALTALNVFAVKSISCNDVAVQPYVVRTDSTDRYHVNLVFLTDAYKDVGHLLINYKVYKGSWVTKPMQATSSPWVYTSNEIRFSRYDRLYYQFEYDIEGNHCKTQTYDFIQG